MKFNKFGCYYNEIGGFQTKDLFSFFIFDFPIVVVRKYQNNHHKSGLSRYYISLLGLTWKTD